MGFVNEFDGNAFNVEPDNKKISPPKKMEYIA